MEWLPHTFKRYRTLQTHHISAMPIAILMPHSACNCRCIMCDIWKDNKNLKQLTEQDISKLLSTFRQLGIKRVLMSGGEALLNPNFFRLCDLLNGRGICVSLHTTGLTLKAHAPQIVENVHDVIVSIDGDESTHDQIRNIPGAFSKLRDGIAAIKEISPAYPITARSVIHRLNVNCWMELIHSAEEFQLDHISFLPADVSSHAFNRQTAWDNARQQEIIPTRHDLLEFGNVLAEVLRYKKEHPDFIAESTEKLLDIYRYYAAFYGLNPFPFKKCNAPWVSVVIEADGDVRPCFFHDSIGNIHQTDLLDILNSERAILFRKELKMTENATCMKCVCSLNLHPLSN